MRQRLAALLLSVALFAALGGRAPAEELRIGAGSGAAIIVEPEILFHTLVADFFIQNDGTVYVQTGDIPAMWLRDSAAQTLPYVRLARVRPALRTWIRGVIERNARNIVVDPYANAFTAGYRVWERKWEVDSLAYPVILAWTYAVRFDDRRVYTPRLHAALRAVVETYECEQQHDRCSRYRFSGLPYRGRGIGSPPTGMIWSAFRPSDDPTTYPYNIPGQMIAAVALDDLAELAMVGYRDAGLAVRAATLAASIRAGVERFGTAYTFSGQGWIFAYEVDAFGRHLTMDDANLPSLLGAPLFGYVTPDDTRYRATRAFVLSRANPYYAAGRYAQGIGSPHTPAGWVWPLALIARALTAESSDEAIAQLHALATTDSSDGLIHESFDPNDPARFTRAEFGWGNAMFAELLFREAAGFGPQLGRAAPVAPFAQEAPRASLRIADRVDQLTNRGLLLTAFEKVVPLPVTGPDPE